MAADTRHRRWRWAALVMAVSACSGEAPTLTDWHWALPDHVAPPPVPESNPMTVEGVELGRRHFFEPRLSVTGEFSCSTCHEPELAFAVDEPTHEGALGVRTARNAPALVNLAWAPLLDWGNPTADSLEQQMLTPLFGDNPVEIGAGFVDGSSDHYDPQRLLELVDSDPDYQDAFDDVFGDRPATERVSWDAVIAAISSFERSLVSLDAPFDRWLAGDPDALSAAEQRGLALFRSSRLGCAQCHAGPLQSLAFVTDGRAVDERALFRNTGLYDLVQGPVVYWGGARTRYPESGQGLGEFTQDPADDGKHRIPSLRNVAVTGPYMHDGSIESLDEVLDHYARGGRLVAEGPHAGDGRDNPNKDPAIGGFALSDTERRDLLAFLGSLTDPSFMDRESALAPR
ncbi:MAG: cytochrome c peroxidase [Myxococcota bacterium]